MRDITLRAGRYMVFTFSVLTRTLTFGGRQTLEKTHHPRTRRKDVAGRLKVLGCALCE